MSRLQREIDAAIRKSQRTYKAQYQESTRKLAFYEKVSDVSLVLFVPILFICYAVFVLSEVMYIRLIAFPGISPQEMRTFVEAVHSPMASMCLVAATIAVAGLCIAFVPSELHGVTWKTRLADLPLGYVAFLAIVIFFACFAIIFAYTLPGVICHILLGVCCWLLVLLNVKAQQWEKRADREEAQLEEKLQDIFDCATEEDKEELRRVKRCEVCQTESLYDLCLECDKKYQGERQRVRNQILRAKQHNVAATLTLVEWLAILESYHHRCAYCYGPYEVLEHYVPIIQGGGTTGTNCVPACLKCNSLKAAKHPEGTGLEPAQAATYKTPLKTPIPPVRGYMVGQQKTQSNARESGESVK